MFKVMLQITSLSLNSSPRNNLFKQQAMQGGRKGIKEKQTEALLAHFSIMAHFHFLPES